MSENEYDDSDLHHDDDDDDKMTEAKIKSEAGVDDNGDVKKKYDPKDPLRPRRKKARRACYACQRAHLTCGMLTLLFFVFVPCLPVVLVGRPSEGDCRPLNPVNAWDAPPLHLLRRAASLSLLPRYAVSIAAGAVGVAP